MNNTRRMPLIRAPRPDPEVDSLRTELFRVTGLLIALLREKHEGRAFVKAELAQQSQHLGVHHQFIPPLGTIRITVVGPNGEPLIKTAEEPPAELPPTPEQAAEAVPEPLTCEGSWHREAEAMGLRCPLCGRSEKVL